MLNSQILLAIPSRLAALSYDIEVPADLPQMKDRFATYSDAVALYAGSLLK